MDTRQMITQLYRDYESGNLANIMASLPDDFRFDSANKVLYTNLSRSDFWNMPGATYGS